MTTRPEPSTFRTMLAVCAIALVLAFVSSTLVLAKSPALPSWSDNATTAAIEDFVTRVTAEGGADFAPVADRIAVFDMDGTLIVEKPMPAALAPIVDGIKEAVAKDPSIAERPTIAAFLKGDKQAMAAAGEAGMVEIISTAVAGRTIDQAAADLGKQMLGPDGKPVGVRSTNRCSNSSTISRPMASKFGSAAAARCCSLAPFPRPPSAFLPSG